MKIYTKTGDKGSTGLLGGERVSKANIRISAYGTVDELNSYIGVLIDLSGEDLTEELRTIQDNLFVIGSNLAVRKEIKMELPFLEDSDIEFLEKKIDWMNVDLPEMRSFILPGGYLASSMSHVARSVCRRAERECVALVDNGELVDGIIIRYLNRLSDYLFVFARYLNHLNKVEDIKWVAKKSGK
jgi:cob(I)alamin adenosyltransferase